MATSLGELATQFGCELIGDPSITVSRVATLSGADARCVSFLSNSAYREQLSGTRAAAVILRAADAEACPVASLVSANPYLLYARIAAVLHPAPNPSAGIHDSAVVAQTPVIEVHISNTFAREEFRHQSFISPNAKGVILGFGLQSYELAIQSFL
jgi:UDP-3-O-[3-hydroxymyristoyl] glucosamine N-acyltransferase